MNIVQLIVTGDMEKKSLAKALKRAFPELSFPPPICLPGFTSADIKNIRNMLSPKKSTFCFKPMKLTSIFFSVVMLKDGSGWGAMTGVSSALMARSGFTGAPALTVESDPVRPTWEDLGGEWRIMGQYFKPHAVCRWAQPSVEAALALQKTHQIRPENMRRISISTFHEAVRLSVRRPRNTEEAQYSLPFPVAAAMVYGKLSASELKGDALTNPAVLGIVDRMELIEDDTFSRRFPARRFARVLIETADSEIYDSGETEAKWDAIAPPADTELREKFRILTREQLSDTRADELETAIWNCAGLSDAAPLLALMSIKI